MWITRFCLATPSVLVVSMSKMVGPATFSSECGETSGFGISLTKWYIFNGFNWSIRTLPQPWVERHVLFAKVTISEYEVFSLEDDWGLLTPWPSATFQTNLIDLSLRLPFCYPSILSLADWFGYRFQVWWVRSCLGSAVRKAAHSCPSLKDFAQ